MASAVLTSAGMDLFKDGPGSPMKKNTKASRKAKQREEAQDKKKAQDKKAAKQPQKEIFATPEKTPEKTLESSDNTYKSSKKNRLGSSAYHKACAAGARNGFSHRFCLRNISFLRNEFKIIFSSLILFLSIVVFVFDAFQTDNKTYRKFSGIILIRF